MKPILVIAALVVTTSSLGAHQLRDSNAVQNGNVKQTLRQLDQEWIKAYLRRDTGLLDRIYADDLVVTNPDGSIGNKAQEIAGIKTGTFRFESITNQDVRVRVFGNMALVSGRSLIKGRYKDQDISGGYRYTGIYIKRRGRWQVIALQITRISEQP